MSSSPFSMPHEPDYAWRLATFFPAQGNWTEPDYLDLTDVTYQFVELADRRLDFLAPRTEVYQALDSGSSTPKREP